MSSKRGGGQSSRGEGNKASPKGKNVVGIDVNHLSQGVQDVNLDSSQDGNWEVISKKNKNRTGNGAASKQWGSQTPKPTPWDAQKAGGRGNGHVRAPNNVWGTQTGVKGSSSNQPMNKYYENNYTAASNTIPPPLQSGWNWNSRHGNARHDAGQRETLTTPHPSGVEEVEQEDLEDNNYTEDLDGSDDELLSEEYDSDESPQSHETRKKNRWYADFFGTLDTLTVEQINEPTRQWHCPACKNGPGSIDWYRSLQSLVTHAKTKGSKRVKIHRDLAEILEEELRRRGATVVPAGEAYGQWKGLNEVVKDREIVWPPMVVVMNTLLEQDENEKWLGMGNQELLDYFGSYAAVKARHSYGPKGHRGMSLLIFESTAVGYTEAERLSKHFEHQGTDRDAWDHRRNLFYPGGKRQLYGYMATKRDLDVFNQHSPGKSKLKFELVSYEEKVVNQLKQMNEDNQQLHYYKTRVAKEQKHSKALEESFGLVSQKLRKTEVENRIIRDRTQQYHKENKEEMDYQEQFFKDQLKVIQEARDAKEGHFDKLQQEECRRVDQSYSVVDPQKREEKLEEMKEFEEEREKLMKLHEEKTAEMKGRHWREEIELEEGLNAELSRLMDKYTSKHEVQG
ncbi:protein SUPPRESSOR OF GENE SILENCING 3 [Cynara cardunculus var. scolymus]|uniref:XS domain-containing protein n=1 Tax=Cynara cardunculus var. scolymus TaxID=59895 RepID=A0A103XMT4_CYNCS|nr:protein SUPPRESSOR OF GENE SILENCING 3 [Cynara cardunculus var. scolymus]XP_024980217.1 protein SUPPRESSOR OF GENE SILENCING 3 [Cynara cardunculus var. scolymus]KVH93617.1 XS domain-containing protein [Cynara cardunculus var. scolymus]